MILQPIREHPLDRLYSVLRARPGDDVREERLGEEALGWNVTRLLTKN